MKLKDTNSVISKAPARIGVHHGAKRDGWLRVAPMTAALERAGLTGSLRDDLMANYLAGTKRGHLSVWIADELSVKILGSHPVEIFKGEWVDAIAFYDGESQ